MWTAAHGCWGAADGMADTRLNVTARVMRARKFLESIVKPKKPGSSLGLGFKYIHQLVILITPVPLSESAGPQR